MVLPVVAASGARAVTRATANGVGQTARTSSPTTQNSSRSVANGVRNIQTVHRDTDLITGDFLESKSLPARTLRRRFSGEAQKEGGTTDTLGVSPIQGLPEHPVSHNARAARYMNRQLTGRNSKVLKKVTRMNWWMFSIACSILFWAAVCALLGFVFLGIGSYEPLDFLGIDISLDDLASTLAIPLSWLGLVEDAQLVGFSTIGLFMLGFSFMVILGACIAFFLFSWLRSPHDIQ